MKISSFRKNTSSAALLLKKKVFFLNILQWFAKIVEIEQRDIKTKFYVYHCDNLLIVYFFNQVLFRD